MKFKMLHLKQRYETYDYVTNKSLKDLSYVYLHHGLLNKVIIMITITLGVKSPHIEIHGHLFANGMYVKVKNLTYNQNSKGV